MEARIAELIGRMSLEQKVGQMIQAEIAAVSPEQACRHHLGSVLNGGGSFPQGDKSATVEDWLALADAFFAASAHAEDGLGIPIIWGTDAVHGHNNVRGATLFPHNIGLGAAHDSDLIEAIGAATAREVAATGIDWTFAPTLAVVRDDRWGRTYEGYSEDPEIVRSYAGRMVDGLQGRAASADFLRAGRVLATAKHYIGEGGTEGGIDQGDTHADELELRDIHGQGYVTALAAGAQTVMAAFNSWAGTKVHGQRHLLTDVLKAQMGFDGFVVSDWNGFKQVSDCLQDACRVSINAGIDMLMVSDDWQTLITDIIGQVRAGQISMARVDDAVTRILRVKLRAGLLEAAKPSSRVAASDPSVVGSPAHRRLAREAVRKSLVLLKNKENILPLARNRHVLVAGDGADDIAKQAGGWSLTWQGTENDNADFPGATSIYGGIADAVLGAGGRVTLSENGEFTERPDVAIVVFGEDPYAEGQGDRADLSFSAHAPASLALLRRLEVAEVPVVSVFVTGRPLWVNPELNASDAFVVAWLPGSEGAGVSDVLFKNAAGDVNYDFTGRLSFSWPRDALQATVNRGDQVYEPLFPYGYGLRYGENDPLTAVLDEEDAARDLVSRDAIGIFRGRVLQPFEMFVGDSGAWKVPVTGRAAESPTGAICVRSVDRKTQEDTRQVTWTGGAPAQVYFQGPRRDLAELAANGGRLQLVLRVDRRPDRPVRLRVDSGYPHAVSLDVTKLLNDLPLGEWRTVAFDLSELADDRGNLHSVDTPFLILTEGALELSLAEVEIVP